LIKFGAIQVAKLDELAVAGVAHVPKRNTPAKQNRTLVKPKQAIRVIADGSENAAQAVHEVASDPWAGFVADL
jgi:hypothetical protein